ncbi:hypothetical protein M3Y99_01532700 [Aphelenchoides fujianensis]|nr:hypothetical protein M3Y99_01532700 [Aphelenchoides fujianensis]
MNAIHFFTLYFLASTCAASVDHDTPARHLPQAKLEFKDLDAAKRIAHAWPTIHSVRQLKQMLVEESPALKNVIDATIRSVHEQFDHAADQFDDETKQFVRQAGGIVAEAKNRLKGMWASASPNVKQHIRRVFPTTNSVIEHPHIQAVAFEKQWKRSWK